MEREDTAQKQTEKDRNGNAPGPARQTCGETGPEGDRRGRDSRGWRSQMTRQPGENIVHLRDPRKQGQTCESRVHGHREKDRDRQRQIERQRHRNRERQRDWLLCTFRGSAEQRE